MIIARRVCPIYHVEDACQIRARYHKRRCTAASYYRLLLLKRKKCYSMQNNHLYSQGRVALTIASRRGDFLSTKIWWIDEVYNILTMPWITMAFIQGFLFWLASLNRDLIVSFKQPVDIDVLSGTKVAILSISTSVWLSYMLFNWTVAVWLHYASVVIVV